MSPCPSRWLVPALLAALAGSSHAAPLDFAASLALAERQAPLLAARDAQIDAAHASTIAASALPDPRLVAGLDNVPVSGDQRWGLNNDPMTMQRIGLMQEFPNGDKRRARAAVALADVGIAQSDRQLTRLQVRRDAALAWLGRYFAERKLLLFDELERENALLDAVVRAQVAGGRGPAADAVLPRQEAVQLGDRRDDLQRDLARARSELRRLVGAAADEPLAGDPPPLAVNAGELQGHLDTHPELQTVDARERRADAEVQEARSGKQSDWGIEVDFQRRAPLFGNMVSVQVTYDLPFFAAGRQDPRILAKLRERDRLAAEREAMLREHASALEGDLADLAALSRQLDRAQAVALPLARQKVDVQTASYQGGRADLGALLAARRELLDLRLRVVDLEGQRAAIAARLNYGYQETAP